MKTTGIIIGRFQTPHLHEGHKFILDYIRQRNDQVAVILGSSPLVATKRNPYDFETRKSLMQEFDKNFIVLELKDHPSDEAWSKQLDELIQKNFADTQVTMYGSRDCFVSSYSGAFKTEMLPEVKNQSASALRKKSAEEVQASEDFRLGINYAVQQAYTKVYPTVDIALFNEDYTRVLLGRKANSPKWRFPGGFADAEDESYETAAARELSEECGDLETDQWKYIGSAEINDWRYRQEADKIITIFFSAHLIKGNPRASDDIVEVKWFSLPELKEMIINNEINPEHRVLIKMLENSFK